MVASTLTLVYLLINLTKIAGSKVSFQTYHGLELPINLYHHISIFHNDNIYIIGGITDNDEPSPAVYKSKLDVPYVDNRDRFEKIETINIALTHHSFKPLIINQITCPNQCYTIINNITYIFIDYYQTSILLKYDLQLETFINVNTYNFFYNSTQFFNGCITNDNNGIIYSIGTTYSNNKDPKRIGLKYNINQDKWGLLYGNINNYEKHSMGCNIDSRNENIYLFGGIPNYSLKLNTIDKYVISSAQIYNISDTLKHPQSSLTITQISGNYFLIYNGYNGIIEYFDANSETILTYDNTKNDNLLFDVANLLLDITTYGSFMVNNILFINGGQSIDNRNDLNKKIKYVNTLHIFDIIINQNTNKMACATIYEPDWTNLVQNAYFIDEYIWNNNNQILFNAIPTNGSHCAGNIDTGNNFSRPVITIISKKQVQYALEYNFTNNALEALHLTAAYLRSGGGTLVTASNVIYNVPYDSVMWTAWNDRMQCEHGGAYFRGGVGSVFDKWSSDYRIGYCFEPNDIINVYFFDYNEVTKTVWEFYHNNCALKMDLIIEKNNKNDTTDNRLFSIGDFINVEYLLYQANKTNVPIYMFSDDILNVNHTIYINELDNDSCVICDMKYDNYSCVNCRDGIPILDLRTWDIYENRYQIDVFTDNNSELFDGSTIFTFERNIVRIGIKFVDVYGNDINFTNGIYPLMQMYIHYQIMSDIIPQYESNVIIELDAGFNLNNNVQFMHFEFTNNTCSFLINDNKTVNCSYPIIIPLDMEFKSIEENKYLFDVYSVDTVLKTNVPGISVRRTVQTIEVIFPESVALRGYLSVEIDVIDDVIYQPNSTVRVISDTLAIDATIYIQYKFPSVIEIDVIDDVIYQPNSTVRVISDTLAIDATIYIQYKFPSGIEIEDDNNNHNKPDQDKDNNDNYYSDELITNCFVYNHNSEKKETCEKGIGPIMVKGELTNDKLKDTINMSSPDTNLENEDANLPRIEGKWVEYNYWIASTDSGKIVTSICPEEYCCQQPDGCVYFPDERQLTDAENNALCAENRNHSVALCGQCNNNYTRVFNSANCKQCDQDNWGYLVYPILVAFAVVFMIMLFDNSASDDTNNTNQQEETGMKHKRLNQHPEMEGILSMLFKVFILFYQSINYILWQAGYKFWGTTMIQILSLDSYIWFWIFHSYPGTDGVCFLEQLTEMHYHGWYLFFPACLIFAIIIYAILFNCICKHFVMCTLCTFGGSTVFTVLFIAIFPVLVVLIIVLSCTNIGDDEYGIVHFYAGDIQCFGMYFIMGCIGMIAVVSIMVVIFSYLKSLGKTPRRDNDYALHGLVRPYEETYWYWEMMLFIRRILIITFITLQYFDKMIMHITLAVLLSIFTLIELICCPFKYKPALFLDIICTIAVILCLIIMIVNIDNDFYHDAVSKNNIISTQTSLGDVNALPIADMSPHQSATFVSISIIIIAPVIFSIIFIIQSICKCIRNSDGTNNTRSNRVRVPGENESEGDTDSEDTDTLGGSTQYKNRDNTLSAILETDDSKTRKTGSLSTYFSRSKKTKQLQKDGYEQMDGTDETDSDDNYDSDDDEKQATRVRKPGDTADETEMVNVNNTNTGPFVRNSKLQKLPIINEKSENKQEASDKSIPTNKNMFAVDMGKEENDSIGVSPNAGPIIIGDSYNNKIKAGGTSPNSNGSFQYTETSNDNYGSNDESTVSNNNGLNPQNVEENMEIISKDHMSAVAYTSAMQNVMNDSDSDDSKQTHNSHNSHNTDSHQIIPLNPSQKDDNDIVKPQRKKTNSGTGTNENDTQSDQGDALDETDMDIMLCDVLDEPTPMNNNNNNINQQKQEENENIPNNPPIITQISSHLSESPDTLKAKKSHARMNAANEPGIEEEWRDEFIHHEQDEMEEQKKRELLKQSTFKNVAIGDNNNNNNNNNEFKRNRNLTSPAFNIGGDNHPDFSVHDSHKTTALIGAAAVKKTDDDISSYSDASGTGTGTGTGSTSYESESSFDSEEDRKSWNEYKENLKKLFSYFAGYQRWNKQKGIYMSKNEVKRFLDIIEITEYWDSDEVFEKMDVDETKRINLDEFLNYFCNEKFNDKAKDLKKYIQKNVSWQLLMKAMDIFEKVDTDHSGQLDENEFKQFGKMLDLDDKETHALWNTVDTDKSGNVTIVELFEWFKKRFEQANNLKKKKKKPNHNNDISSQFTSHDSFSLNDDDEDDDDESQSESEDESNSKNNNNKENTKLSYSSEHRSPTPFSANKNKMDNVGNDNNTNVEK